MSADLDTLSDRILSALGNGMYQGLILTVLVWAGLKLARRASATTRFAVELATLWLVAALPVMHFLADDSRPPASAPAPAPVPEPVEVATPVERPSLPPEFMRVGSRVGFPNTVWISPGPDRPVELQMRHLPRFDALTGSGSGGDTAASTSLLQDIGIQPALGWMKEPEHRAGGFRDPGGRVPGPNAVGTQGRSGDPVLKPDATSGAPEGDLDAETVGPAGWLAWRTSWDSFVRSRWRPTVPPSASLLVIGLWSVLTLARLIHLGWQCSVLERLKAMARPVSPHLVDAFGSLCAQMEIRRRVVCAVSPDLDTPIAAGYLRPAVLVPSGLVHAPEADLERVLRHELAHIRRRDDWTNLFQHLIKAVYFFHPSVLWLSRRLTVDREIACDDHVLSATRAHREYALFLTNFANRPRTQVWAAAPAAWSNTSQLKERIHMILDPKRNASPRLGRTCAGTLMTAALMIAAIGLYTAPRLALAQAPAATLDASLETVVSDGGDSLVIDSGDTEHAEAAGSDCADPHAAASASAKAAKAKAKAKAANKSRSANINANIEIAEPTPEPRPRVSRRMALAIPAPVIVGTPAVPRVAPVPEDPAAPPRPAASPAKPKHRQGPVAEAGSVEERLERVERLVESLVKRERGDAPRPKPGAFPKDFHFEGPAVAFGAMPPHKDGNPSWPQQEARFKAMSRALEQVGHEMEQAAKEAERAVMDAEKSMKDSGRNAADAFGGKEPLEMTRRMMEEKRRALQKHISEVESQLDRLEEQLDQVEDRFNQAEEARERSDEQREKVAGERARMQEQKNRTQEEKGRLDEEKARAKEEKARVKEEQRRKEEAERRKEEERARSRDDVKRKEGNDSSSEKQ